ncbi:MFS transporter [Chitinophaga varians]|uniref:MFS transporter n=1 Tax=Chitinophaga varians TaxID=2202339 RepID=UPI00165F1870|nr:MFS transporter [Chitinophaga varians]MBC9909778.1 MFS transporter [Chitinophaga varians]
MDTKAQTATNAGWTDLFAGNNKYKASALALGVLLHVTNIYIVATIMPSIVREIGGLAYYAWNTTIFVVASIIGSVVSARLLSVSGPRKAYRWAILLFATGAVISMAAPTMYVLLLARAVQGLGGGLLFALSYGMIRIIFESRLWARAMALISGMWGVGAFVGPFVGGIFAEYGNWRTAFAVILVIGVLLLVFTEFILPTQHTAGARTPVPVGKLLLLLLSALAVSIGSVMESLMYNLAGLLVALLLIALLVRSERGSQVRLLPTGAYRLSSPLGMVYLIIVLLALVAAVEIFIPYFEQTIHGFTALEAGYLTVLVAFGWTVGSMSLSGAKASALMTLALIGALLMIVGLAGMVWLSGAPYNIYVLVGLCIALLLIGVGIGLPWPHLVVRVFSLAPPNEIELTAASITTVQLMAMTFGAALSGLIANAGGMTHPGGVAGAMNAVTWLYGCFIIPPALAVVMLLTKGMLKKTVVVQHETADAAVA